ncbi:MAG: NADH-quinone oxidoreductase subunit NuoK [Candidatus Bathyarchaeia archaeon]
MPLDYVLILSALLFSVGVYAALTRRSAILVLMAIEIMLNAANINFVAFSMYSSPFNPAGQAFAVVSIAIAAAEAGVGLAIMLSLYKRHQTIELPDVKELKY